MRDGEEVQARWCGREDPAASDPRQARGQAVMAMDTTFRYFQIGSDLWRLSGQHVEFRDRDGDWHDSILPVDMFLVEAGEDGFELSAEQVSALASESSGAGENRAD